MRPTYDFEAAEVRRFLKHHGAKRAAIQLPEGLRPHLAEITAVFGEVGVEAVVLADSCYGACDLADAKAEQLGCGVLIHYGHADMGLPTSLPTLYVEAHMLVDPLEAVEGALSSLGFKRVGLTTTAQHITHLPGVAELIRSRGAEPIVGKPGPRAKYPGQVLGCDFGAATSVSDRVDGYIYIGTGEFHPLGAALATGKRVVAVNPVAKGFKVIAPSLDFLNKRKAMIARATACERFGIVVSTKPGQARFKLASALADAFRGARREAHVLVVDEVQPEKLCDFKLDAFVCAACPRVPIDDAERFDRPILTPFEAGVMLGKASFEPYRLDEVRASDFG